MASTLPLTQVRALGPTTTLRLPPSTYLGDTNTVRMSEVDPADQAALRALYRLLMEVREAVEPSVDAPADAFAAVRAAVTPALLAQAHALATSLGRHLTADATPLAVRQAFHDVRGGSLMALLMHLELVLDDEAEPQDAQRLFLLCRDQLKMMRNAILDLDPPRYQADLEESDHAVDLLREKWTDVRYLGAQGSVRVAFASDFHGRISQRCMEFSALDRVIYNLVNNATRFSADGTVSLLLSPTDDARDTHVRFAVVNQVTPAQRAALIARFHGEDLGALFDGGFTTGGHGIGLRICADFVVHGYGLPSLRRARDDGYLGARLVGDAFVAWFVWPGRREDPLRATG